MNIGIGVALYFAGDVNEKIIETWKSIDEAGFKSPLFMKGQRPHISFINCSGESVSEFAPKLEKLCKETKSFEITLSQLSFFTVEPSIAFYGITPEKMLFDLHTKISELAESSSIDIFEYYKPNQWVPHCSLAGGIKKDDLYKFVRDIQFMNLPQNATVSQVGLATWKDFTKIEQHAIYDLK